VLILDSWFYVVIDTTGGLELLHIRFIMLVLIVVTILAQATNTESVAATVNPPSRSWTVHDIGHLVLSIHNSGFIGDTPFNPALDPDYVTGEPILNGSEFPKGSGRGLLCELGGSSLWIAGILNGDTLVSAALDLAHSNEMGPDWINGKAIDARSSLDSVDLNHRNAVSEQDRVVAYTDTIIDPRYYDFVDRRLHMPLGLKLTQESYAWSYSYAADIVFFNVTMRNIGKQVIREAYIGWLVSPDVRYARGRGLQGVDVSDDVCGYLHAFTHPDRCGWTDTLELAWAADNDGSPFDGVWADRPVYDPVIQGYKASNRSIFGIRFLGSITDLSSRSFNWWSPNYYIPANDFGPMRKDNVRDFGTAWQGSPDGNRNMYFVMSNGEVDYDLPYTTKISRMSDWLLPPPALALDLADGKTHHFLLSYGPLDIAPGTEFSFAFCIVAAENFHMDPNNGANLPDNPQAWYDNVDFSGLAKNAVWAEKIYDNPGYDTDGDGYAGEFRVCVYESVYVDDNWQYTRADTEWYKGDGVPDWRAAGPPHPPDFWLTPTHNGIHVRFNGQVAETEKDILSQIVDFEGYRIYLGRDERETSYSLVASYDTEDYDKYVFNPNLAAGPDWELRDLPFPLDSLRCLYGSGPEPCNDSTFDPLSYTRSHAYQHPDFPDSVFFFVQHDYNASTLGDLTPITKTYPDYPNPHLLPPDSITDDMYTDDGYYKFYEYEFSVTGLLATVPYWINVTAFDFGSPEAGLEPLESSITLNAKSAYPIHTLDRPVSGSDKVYVYPNPYRIDEPYRHLGYEGRTRNDRSDDRVRAIWFGNLPPQCTIRIFSLDGDRVRTLRHDYAAGDPMGSRHKWDLINRNMQRIVSGLYYWTVETPDGDVQTGKLAVIR